MCIRDSSYRAVVILVRKAPDIVGCGEAWDGTFLATTQRYRVRVLLTGGTRVVVSGVSIAQVVSLLRETRLERVGMIARDGGDAGRRGLYGMQ